MLVLPSFLVPFVFIFSHELLLMGSPVSIALAVISASAGIFAFSIITEGWVFGKVPIALRVLLGGAVICLLTVGTVTDLIGYAILAVVLIHNYWTCRRKRPEGTA